MKPLRTYSPESVAHVLSIAAKYVESHPETAANVEKLVTEYWQEYERKTWGRGA